MEALLVGSLWREKTLDDPGFSPYFMYRTEKPGSSSAHRLQVSLVLTPHICYINGGGGGCKAWLNLVLGVLTCGHRVSTFHEFVCSRKAPEVSAASPPPLHVLSAGQAWPDPFRRHPRQKKSHIFGTRTWKDHMCTFQNAIYLVIFIKIGVNHPVKRSMDSGTEPDSLNLLSKQ
jgi:hypothetical protein